MGGFDNLIKPQGKDFSSKGFTTSGSGGFANGGEVATGLKNSASNSALASAGAGEVAGMVSAGFDIAATGANAYLQHQDNKNAQAQHKKLSDITFGDTEQERADSNYLSNIEFGINKRKVDVQEFDFGTLTMYERGIMNLKKRSEKQNSRNTAIQDLGNDMQRDKSYRDIMIQMNSQQQGAKQ